MTGPVCPPAMSPADHPPIPLLAARALVFDRDGERILGPLDFELHAGGTLLVEGGNGSGKTTLLRLLAGLLDAAGGSLHWCGERLGAGCRPPPGAIALLGHAPGLKPELSALENLRWRVALDGPRPGMRPAIALRAVGLEGYEHAPVRTLSAGQRKRAGLAGLLCSAATLWLMDEPYANLDREGQRLVERMLETHAARGGAAIVTSHGLAGPAAATSARIELGALH